MQTYDSTSTGKEDSGKGRFIDSLRHPYYNHYIRNYENTVTEG